MINADEPKSPVSKGKSGSLTGRLSVVYPKNPARMKIVNASQILFSLRIRNNEVNISRKGSKFCRIDAKVGIIKMKIGVNIAIMISAEIEP